MRKLRRFSTKFILIVLLCIISLAIISPVLFILTNSFMSTREILFHGESTYAPAILLPERLSLEHYNDALLNNPEFYPYFWNTVILVIPILLGSIFVSVMGSYGFAKFDFPGKKALYYLCVFLVMMPYQIMLSPQYIILRKIGLLGTRAGLILAVLFAPIGLFLMTEFMKAVPGETLEAARMDGANEFQVFYRIALPQASPGIGLLALFVLVENWNLVEQPLILLSSSIKYPLSVSLSFLGSQRPEIVYVCAVIFLIPVLLCFMFGVRSMIQSLKRLME